MSGGHVRDKSYLGTNTMSSLTYLSIFDTKFHEVIVK